MGPLFTRNSGRFRVPTPGRIDPGRFPRGMRTCIPFLDPSFCDIGPGGRYADRWPRRGSAVSYFPSESGWGAKFSGATGGTNCLSWKAQFTSIFSIDILFRTGSSVTSQLLCEFNNVADGTSNTTHQALAFNGSSQLTFYVYDGTVKVATDSSTTYAANTLYHACGVADGTNIRLYLNGRLVATTACGASPDPWNGTGPYFIVGAGTHFQLSANLASSATVLHAGWADLPWTPAEVWERAVDPFSYLSSDEDEFLLSVIQPPAFRSNAMFAMFPP